MNERSLGELREGILSSGGQYSPGRVTTSLIQPAGQHDGDHECAVNTLKLLVYCGTKTMMIMIHTFMHDQYVYIVHSMSSIPIVAGDDIYYMLVSPLYKRAWIRVKSKLRVSFSKRDAIIRVRVVLLRRD